MRETNRLGLRVVGMTAAVLVVLAALYWVGQALLFGDRDTPDESTGQLSLTEAQRDTDGDGVADFYETTFYNTDINNPDTDGDGVSDLDEITSGRDPLIPAPQDVSKPPTGSQITDRDTFTRQYLAELPDDAGRDEILDQTRLAAFVDANRGVLLPEVSPSEIQTTEGAGAEVVEAYLDSISSDHNSQLQAVTSTDLETAFRLQVNSGNAEPMRQVVTVLETNIAVLKDLAAPLEALELHTKLLAASIALHNNAVLLRDIDADFVGGLIAARNVEDLGSVFQEIAQGVQALEEQYELE